MSFPVKRTTMFALAVKSIFSPQTTTTTTTTTTTVVVAAAALLLLTIIIMDGSYTYRMVHLWF